MAMQLAHFHRYNFLPEIPGEVRFNASIIESGDGYLIAFRNSWKYSRIYGAWLDRNFQPTGRWKKIDFPKCAAAIKGHEDPRFFRHNGGLWMAYVGFTGFTTSVLYARLDEQTLEVEAHYWPQYMDRDHYEKSWSMFSHDGRLHAVYSTQPHCIMTFSDPGEGEDPLATKAYTTPFAGKWSGGPMRGGASPLLIGDEWWHWMHGYTMQDNGRRLYTMGVVRFEDKPPFRVTRYTPEPLDVADPNAHPVGEKNDSIFPCGAILRDDELIVSMGVQDHCISIRSYPLADIERRLVKHDGIN